MIHGICVLTGHTGQADEKWPAVFAFPPRVGDWVRSASGKVALVVGVTHRIVNTPEAICGPAIEVEIRQ